MSEEFLPEHPPLTIPHSVYTALQQNRDDWRALAGHLDDLVAAWRIERFPSMKTLDEIARLKEKLK